jgi:hypothetical protein
MYIYMYECQVKIVKDQRIYLLQQRVARTEIYKMYKSKWREFD